MEPKQRPIIVVQGTRAERLVARAMGVLLCLGLAFFWAATADAWIWNTGLIGLGGMVDAGPDGVEWIRSCWYREGVLLIAMVLAAYAFAARHRAWPLRYSEIGWLVVGYAVFPLAATAVLAICFRISLGYWACTSACESSWGTLLIAYGAGYLFALPRGASVSPPDEAHP